MSNTTKTHVVELSQHTPLQLLTFWTLILVSAILLFLVVAVPLFELFFETFLRSHVVYDGTAVSYQMAENRPVEHVTTGLFSVWALVDPRDLRTAEYLFRPILALTPLVLVGSFTLAALLTSLFPAGYLRQKIEREILLALDRLAFVQFGEHTPQEILSLTNEIINADTRRLHDLADIYRITFPDLELLRRALLWRNSYGILRFLKTHDAVKFYMREYFTDRYSNAVLGLVYMGAAILIIVIGVRGLKFLPATDPSMVLSALGLEFILLITYAAILMYGRAEDSIDRSISSDARGHTIEGMTSSETELLVRALMAAPKSGMPEENR